MNAPRRIGIAGLGLVGGSLARALVARQAGAMVLGWDPDERTLREAQAAGAIGGAASSLAELAAGVDLLVLASPVDAILSAIDELALARLPEALVVTDVGSTKAAIIERAEKLPVAFVGGHPIAGAELRGFGASRADLFAGAAWALVPPEKDEEGRAFTAVRALVERVGARPVLVDAAIHDAILARTSHLPQVLAVALANVVAGTLDRHPEALDLAGRGLADMLRIAASPHGMWAPVLSTNHAEVAAALEELMTCLREAGDPTRAAEAFVRAAHLRERLR